MGTKLRRHPQAREAYVRAGDAAAAQRVADKERTLAANQSVEAEIAEIRAIREEEERLGEELKSLPGGCSPDDQRRGS